MLSPERLSLPGPEYLGEERRGGAGRLPEGSLPLVCCGPAWGGPARPSRGLRRAAPGWAGLRGSVCALAGERAAPGRDRAGLSGAEVGGLQTLRDTEHPSAARRCGLRQQRRAELPSPRCEQ